MKEVAIKNIERQINHHKAKLGKYPKLRYSDIEIERIRGTIFGLEQAIISIRNS